MTHQQRRSADLEWSAALDCFEASLDHHSEMLAEAQADRIAAGTDPWPAHSMPSSPLPAELQQRALALHQRSLELLDDVAKQMTNMDMPRRPRPANRATTDHPRLSVTL